MTNSTIAADPRFALREQRVAAGRRYRPSAAGGLCSPAGLHPRPWLARLRRALREGSFELHYQPIVDLRTGEVSHCEALVRLADEPGGRLTAPGAFLPAAERYGLVCEIDRMVVARVAALLGATAAGGLEGGAHGVAPGAAEGCAHGPAATGTAGALGRRGMRVAVNLSALSVTDAGMPAHIERELARHGVDPARLVVEITETAAICDMRRARAFCEEAQALGCAIALDDFGVGFGSLYYAKRLPFRYLKIDGDFVRDLCAGARDRVMVRAIVDLARGMGGETIAEFVGDEPTMELLRELGVDYAQGFQVGRPRPLLAA